LGERLFIADFTRNAGGVERLLLSVGISAPVLKVRFSGIVVGRVRDMNDGSGSSPVVRLDPAVP